MTAHIGCGGKKEPWCFSLTPTYVNHLPELPTPGENLSDTWSPCWCQYQEKCQNHIGTGALQLQEYSQPHPEHKEQQSQDIGYTDILGSNYRMVTSQMDTLRQTYNSRQSAGESFHPLNQLYQQYVETSTLWINCYHPQILSKMYKEPYLNPDPWEEDPLRPHLLTSMKIIRLCSVSML